jgi:L-asparaginase
MARVVVAFTGGTISMERDPEAGGNIPTLGPGALLDRIPGLALVAEVVPVDLGRIPASHFTFSRLFTVLSELRARLADPGIDGAVVVQGTDAIEETAFFFDLLWDDPRPLVVTGAMRAASDLGYEGPANLRDAIRAAASPDLRGTGVSVLLAGVLHPADDVIKTHTSAYETFQSPNGGPLGRMEGDRLVLLRRRVGRRQVVTDRAAEPVDLIVAVAGDDGGLLEASRRRGARGIVVAATGAGNTSPELLAAGRRAMEAGIPVVLTTRCPSGRASAAYAFPGGGATWVQAGAILAGYLGGPKARIALALGLGAGLDREGLVSLFADPLADGTPAGGWAGR